MKIVIAEKPSVARELAKVFGATNKKAGYIEGKGYSFTWAFGHLLQLAPPQDLRLEAAKPTNASTEV
jgi:DNA topoisomerase-3